MNLRFADGRSEMADRGFLVLVQILNLMRIPSRTSNVERPTSNIERMRWFDVGGSEFGVRSLGVREFSAWIRVQILGGPPSP
jgi:hypothetical protein